MLRLLIAADKESIRIEQIRILDFYLLFPCQINNITLPRESVGIRKYLAKNLNQYEKLDDDKLIFARMEHYQISALRCLSSYNIIDHESLKEDLVLFDRTAIPVEIKNIADTKNEKETELMTFLINILLQLNLLGSKGLKSRTGLLEHRYDPT